MIDWWASDNNISKYSGPFHTDCSELDCMSYFCPTTLNEGRNCDAWGLVLVIRRYLKFTAWSERELSVHPCCLHSFSSERWTRTSSDRTQVNVYLSPFLSSWEFALRPDRKPLASPLSVSSLLFTAASAVEQPAGYNTDKVKAVRAETAETQDAGVVTFSSTAGGKRPEGQYLLKNVYYELERLNVGVVDY